MLENQQNFYGINFTNGYTVLLRPAYSGSCSGVIFNANVSNFVEVYVFFGCKDVSSNFIEKKTIRFTSKGRKKEMVQTEVTNHSLTADEFAELIQKVNCATTI